MINDIKYKKLTTGKLVASKALSGLLLVIASFYVTQAQAVTDTLTTSGTWTAPAGVSSVTVEVWGGGGAGGGNPTSTDGGGGGGGGGYSRSIITVVPGTGYTVVVGAGGTGVVGGAGNGGGQSYFINAATVRANGGAGGGVATNVGGAGGAGGALGVGTIRFSGGNGGTGLNSNNGQGGPGGSSAGTAANGTSGANSWTTATAAAPPAGGGIGGDGDRNADGNPPASGNGGGGGGSGDNSGPGGSRAGGGGAAGKVVLTYTPSPGGSVTANPTLCVNDASIGVATGNWSGLTNVGTQNNVYAQASVANSDITNYLKCTNYGFSIPAGATITGITVGPWLNASWTMVDNAMRLVKGGAIQTTNLATGANIPNGGGAFAASPTQFTYGSSSNLWGNIWTVADINSANFGAAFAAQRGGFSSTQQAGVDAMPITISYTLPAFPTVVSINRTSLDPAAPATAVTWTITFSASVTGVDTADFALVQAGGVSGASITSATGSGTTWSATANTGSGSGTLGLNLVDNDSIIDGGGKQLGGTGVGNGNFTGQVYTIAAPLTCITDNFSTGTLDTSLWDVKTIQGPYLPQVVNAGGGDYRLRLTDTNNNEATFAQLKRIFPAAGNKVVLEIDYFAYGGSGADGIAIAFSDATIASTTGGFGGSLGYAQNGGIAGFGGGWLGVGLDEYGNFPNPTEARNNYPAGWVAPAPANVAAGFYKTNVSVRGSGSGTSGYSLLANTGLLATPVAPASGAAGATPYRYRITLDHSNGVSAYVTVERDTSGTGASYTTVIPKFDAKGASSGQAAVPANWLLSFTGSTGGATNNHEFKQVKICANTIIGGGPHHLEIQHASGTGLTCTPSTLNIRACADAACTTAYTAGVTGTLSKTGSPTVNWSGGNSFSIPSGSSTVSKNVQVTTPGSVVFGAVSTPAAASATTCNFGAPGCTFVASDTGLLLSAPNHVAETAAALTVQAVKKADNSLACVPAFANTTKTVNLKCAYSNPATGTLPVRVGGTALNATANTAAACDAGGANVSLNFDATGTATSALQYADVGQMNLIASYTGAAGALDAGLSMTGAASFIAAPASFAFTNLPAGPTIKSGNPFSVTVSALNNAGAVSPNFGKESVPGPAGVTLTSNLVTPDPVTYPSAANPVPGNNVIAGTEFGAGGMVADANGAATVNNLSWGEVGSITLLANLTNTNGYLGSAGTPTRDALNNILTASGTSATIGAFIPDHFDTAVVPTLTLPMPCPTGLTCPVLYNGFVYSGQAFRMQVIARNLAGGTTTNYSSIYGLANNVDISAWDALGSLVAPGGAGALANGTLASGAFISGVGSTFTQAYTFATSLTAPGDIFLRAVDTVNTSVTSRRATPATSVEGGVKVVSGKLAITNGHGSELLPLPLTVSVQYWDNTDWVTSTTDDVTQFNTNLSTAGGNILANILTGLAGGVSVASPSGVMVLGGVKTFTLNAPMLPGSADISLNAPGYLLAGSNGAGINPSEAGRVTFGIFKGSENIIYIRESYNR